MKKVSSLVACVLFLGAQFTFAEKEQSTIVYPTKDKPSFMITVPDDWELTAAEEKGDYFHLDGPTGAIFSMRTIEGTDKALTKSMKDSLESVNKKFDDVEVGDAKDWKPSGLTGFYAVGTAKEKKTGTELRIAFAWCALENDEIAELWFVTDLSDEKGMDQANKIINSLRAPKK